MPGELKETLTLFSKSIFYYFFSIFFLERFFVFFIFGDEIFFFWIELPAFSGQRFLFERNKNLDFYLFLYLIGAERVIEIV